MGRPQAEINFEEVEFLRTLNLKWGVIATMIGVSRQTLYRRLKEEGILEEMQFTSISDSDLDDVIRHIKIDHPNDGEVLVGGHLHAQGIRTQRYRLRAALHRVDPSGIADHRSRAIVRRTYHVEHPSYVWHIDGHHKLIRWRLVTHGGIDGYSRLITFLRCSTNNTAPTVLSAFSGAVHRYGVPLRVRSDLGGENVDVWRFMIAQHNGDESVVITGSSTHNERIERLWRDVFRCVAQLFYDTFHSLEVENLLNPLNEADIYCLHYVYVPIINKCLQEFTESWNHHRLSSEHNNTPYQLFVTGLFNLETVNTCSDSNLANIPTGFSTVNPVDVPRSTFQPCPILEQLLTNSIDTTHQSGDLGVGAYKNTVALVGTHVTVCQSCSDLNE